MKDQSFLFWQKCLTYANVLTVIVGLLVAFFGNSIFFEMHNNYTETLFFEGMPMEGKMLDLKNWLFGIIGGTIVGFHVLMIMISEFAFKQKERWAYWAMCSGLLSWFIIDSGISIYYGAMYNVVLINIVALILIGIPLVMTFRVFNKPQ